MSMSWLARRCLHTTRPVLSRIGSTPIPIPPNITTRPHRCGAHCHRTPRHRVRPAPSFHQTRLADAPIDNRVHRRRSLPQPTRHVGHDAHAYSECADGDKHGFSTPLYLVGVGYRAAMEEDPRGRLAMKLGYSHTVYVPIPPWVDAKVETPTKIVLSATDKHLLGLFSARVRAYRKPEPYKGKGIYRYRDRTRQRA
ncbi:ribosomal protein L6 [Hymenopellis radicata]|nr:ribosomal protein L6 [Hymenopellis radicata]